MVTIGIDPGWSSFGIAITKDSKVVAKTSFVPKNYGTIITFIHELHSWILKETDIKVPINSVYIERFVTYSGVQADGENILMLIGALDYYFSTTAGKPNLVKAIDWKIKLCQHLVKTKGVSNPYTKLDKKFSIWAATQLSGLEFKSDHEADAVCLSYLNSDIIKVKV